MEQKKMIKIKQLNMGYGTRFGYYGNTSLWASASAGLLHVWHEYALIKSHVIPGYVTGNLVFTQDGIIRIGLFEVDSKSSSKRYLNRIAENFSFNTVEQPAHFSQYKIVEVLNFADADLLVAAIAIQPGKKSGAPKINRGSTNRLLLFERSSGNVLQVIAENDQHLPYSNLIAAGSHLCYDIDGLNCIASIGDSPDKPAYTTSLDNFIGYDSIDNKYIAGAYNNRLVQFREAESLRLVQQLPVEYEAVNGLCVSSDGNFVFAGVNQNVLHCWNRNNDLVYTQSVQGTIEALGLAMNQLCMTAVAGNENMIEVFKLTDRIE
jgi:hypothetical protein